MCVSLVAVSCECALSSLLSMSFLGRLAASAAALLVGRHNSDTVKSTTRIECRYGAKCYRKNPQHRLEEWHPGDPEDPTRQEPASASSSSSAPTTTSNVPSVSSDSTPSPTPAVSGVDSTPSVPLTGTPRHTKKKMSARARARAGIESSPESIAATTEIHTAVAATPTVSPSTVPPSPAPSTAPSGPAPLIASLHALHPTPLVPEFTEIRSHLERGSFLIGRRPTNHSKAGQQQQQPSIDLILETSNPRLSKMISRHHAKIEWTRKEVEKSQTSSSTTSAVPSYIYSFSLIDCGSVNGVFLNSVKLSSTEPHRLGPEDKILFGGGAGIEPGTYVRHRQEDQDFLFRFNCIQRTVIETTNNHATTMTTTSTNPASIDDSTVPVTGTRVRARVAKRALSSATSTAPRPQLKRLKSEELTINEESKEETNRDANDNDDDDDDGESRSASPVVTSCDDGGATQSFGDDGDMTTSADDFGSTQDYHDADRDAAREAAAQSDTQDFGADIDDGQMGGAATQDQGGDIFQ